MARTVRDAKLDSGAARAKLKLKPGDRKRKAIAREVALEYRADKLGGVWRMRRYLGAGEDDPDRERRSKDTANRVLTSRAN